MNMKMRAIGLVPSLFAGLAMLMVPGILPAQIGISITVAPPPLPVYVQPPCPVDGYLWTPGYWAYGPAGYYWVPGVWVAPPRVGLLWTPAYWGFVGGVYGFHAGYWGPHVGFYGGINYGFGYGGVGFAGGAWRGGAFAYNTAVLNVNTTIVHNTYNERVVLNNGARASFNGPGGTAARPSPQELAAGREQHVQSTANQLSHEQSARADRGQLASVNHGRPGNMAMARPMSTGASHNAGAPPHAPANNGHSLNNTHAGNAGQSHPMESAHTNGSPNNGGKSAPKAHAPAAHRAEKPEGKER